MNDEKERPLFIVDLTRSQKDAHYDRGYLHGYISGVAWFVLLGTIVFLCLAHFDPSLYFERCAGVGR